ncbi:HalOD1 output domain-containing protein [Natronolimnobius baerhuensis]|uniref:HalOD1 output domain-containing protein n=1 Tax=Natronolimnobius baerhuensis TaxID=253108 RepID=UPI001FE75523|nr:HalOD1 output domain-containing protein [Natronolimnobius baerhuensis]
MFEILEALAEEGLERDEYQLGEWIDVEALEQLVDSASQDTEIEIRFTVSEFRVLVTGSDLTVS